MIDEFAAIAPAHVSRLFARARSAGIGLLLGTQSSPNKTAADGLREPTAPNEPS